MMNAVRDLVAGYRIYSTKFMFDDGIHINDLSVSMTKLFQCDTSLCKFVQ